MAVFTFSVLDWKHPFFGQILSNGDVHFFRFWLEIPFLGKFCQKIKIVSLNWKLDTNLNVQNSMVVFTFFVLDRKRFFCANLVQKIKIVSLSWNLVPRSIWICWIQWWCSLFLFYTKTPFFTVYDLMGVETLKQAAFVNIL